MNSFVSIFCHRWNWLLVMVQLFLARQLEGERKIRYLDIGASAMTKPRVAIAFHELEVVAFDPDPRSEADFNDLGFEVEFHPFAVAGSNGLRKLHLTKKSHCSSLLKPLPTDDRRYQVEREIEVECRTLDSFGIKADALKIDVQGAELEVLMRAKNTLASAHVVELEVWFERKYENQARIEEIQHWMTEQGFKSAGFSALYLDKAEAKSSVAFADMVFVRSAERAHGRKVVLVALIDAALDRLIPHFLPDGCSTSVDTMIMSVINMLAAFKFRAPQIH